MTKAPIDTIRDALSYALKSLQCKDKSIVPELMKKQSALRCKEALSVLDDCIVMQNWKPIETAPKTSPVPLVDLWFPDAGNGEGYRMADCYWSVCGYWSQIGNGGKPLGQLAGEPTHWTPLPPAPKTKDE